MTTKQDLIAEKIKVDKGCIAFNIDKKRDCRCIENPERRLCYQCKATSLTLQKGIDACEEQRKEEIEFLEKVLRIDYRNHNEIYRNLKERLSQLKSGDKA